MAFTEDLSPFFELSDFAVEATIKNGSTTVRTAKVIFDSIAGPLDVLAAEVQAGSPKARIKTDDLAGVVLNTHTIVINSVTYRIVGREDDGTGVSTILLKV